MHSKAATRRRHDDELKAKVLAECDEAGASVAAVAQSHGLNANLVHKWRRNVSGWSRHLDGRRVCCLMAGLTQPAASGAAATLRCGCSDVLGSRSSTSLR